MKEPEQCDECGQYFPAECLEDDRVTCPAGAKCTELCAPGQCPLCGAVLFVVEV